MAEIIKETIVVNVSRIVKDGSKSETIITDEILQTIETVSEQLFDGAVVEVVRP